MRFCGHVQAACLLHIAAARGRLRDDGKWTRGRAASILGRGARGRSGLVPSGEEVETRVADEGRLVELQRRPELSKPVISLARYGRSGNRATRGLEIACKLVRYMVSRKSGATGMPRVGGLTVVPRGAGLPVISFCLLDLKLRASSKAAASFALSLYPEAFIATVSGLKYGRGTMAKGERERCRGNIVGQLEDNDTLCARKSLAPGGRGRVCLSTEGRAGA